MIKQLAESVFHIRAYPEFTRQKRGPFSYILLLTALYFCIAILIPVGAFLIRNDGYNGIITTYCPDFVIEDGELTVEKPIFFQDKDVYFDIDTERPFFIEDVRGALSDREFAFLADKSKCYIRTEGEEKLISFRDYRQLYISRDLILSMKKNVYIIGASMLMMLYLFAGIGFYILIRILGILALIVIRLVVDEPRPGYRGATIICARAATLPVIVLSAASWITATFLNGKFVMQAAQIIWVLYMIAAIYLIQKESEELHEAYLKAYRERMAEDARMNGESYEDRMYEDRAYTDIDRLYDEDE